MDGVLLFRNELKRFGLVWNAIKLVFSNFETLICTLKSIRSDFWSGNVGKIEKKGKNHKKEKKTEKNEKKYLSNLDHPQG